MSDGNQLVHHLPGSPDLYTHFLPFSSSSNHPFSPSLPLPITAHLAALTTIRCSLCHGFYATDTLINNKHNFPLAVNTEKYCPVPEKLMLFTAAAVEEPN